MREIVLDTETTGISPQAGHRIVEIGALELVNQVPTGERYHVYINPERDMEAGAVEIHGLTAEFLADMPVFSEIVDKFLEFIGDSRLVIHNAEFDMGFINAELGRLKRKPLAMSRSLDTLSMARKKFPGSPASLDALCKRYEIDNSHRELHGALVDADLLASVYVEMLGGHQHGLTLEAHGVSTGGTGVGGENGLGTGPLDERFDRPHDASDVEKQAHEVLLARMDDPLWHR